jgi:GNAT superfamily N-acetyltransferase
MDARYNPLQRLPASLTETEIGDFIAMVRAGGEIGGNVLERNVRAAASLLTVRQGECLVGVAALKNPLPSYRKKIQEKSGVDLDPTKFPLELGYVFVLPSAGGQGIATALCATALGDRDQLGIFATTRVDAMAHILCKLGFQQAGRSYASTPSKGPLRVFVRSGRPVSEMPAAPSRQVPLKI